MKFLIPTFLSLVIYSQNGFSATKLISLPDDAKNVSIESLRLEKVPSGKTITTESTCNPTADSSDCDIQKTPIYAEAVALKISYNSRSEGHYESGSGDESRWTDISEKTVYFSKNIFNSKDLSSLKSRRNLEIAKRLFNLEVKTKDYSAKVIDQANSKFCAIDSEGNPYDKNCVEQIVYRKVPATGRFLTIKTI